MESIEYNKQRKSTLKSLLTRFHGYVEKFVYLTSNKDELKSKLIKQDKEATEFDRVITILSCATDDKVEQDRLYDESDEYNLTYSASRNEALQKLGFAPPEPFVGTSTLISVPPTSINTAGHATTVNKAMHVQAIPLPSFNGQMTQWPEFADVFTSLVISNTSLTNVERLLHLKSCLVGDAAKTISNISILDVHFDVAWNILKKQYDDPKLLVETRIKALFALPKINENPNSIRELLNQFRTNCDILTANKSLTLDNLLIQFAIVKFDEETREKWEEYSYDIHNPSYEDILEFLNQRTKIRVAATKHSVKKPRESTSQFVHFTTNAPNDKQMRCDYCSEASHRIYSCMKFINLNLDQRCAVVKDRKWCINCLGTGHMLKQCKSQKHCFKCSKRHNTLLHNNNLFTATAKAQSQHTQNAQQAPHFTQSAPTQTQTAPPQPQTATTSVAERTFTNSVVDCKQPTQILLSTVLIDIINHRGERVQCRALLDNGSQPHIITEKLAHVLGLTYTQKTAQLAGIGTAATTTKGFVTLKLCSKYNSYEVSICATIVTTITHNLPSYAIDTNTFQLPSDVVLADPQFGTPAPIDLIIGADLFYQLLRAGKYYKQHGPTLQETELGWVIAGRVTALYPPKNDFSFHVRAVDPLELQLRKFWEIESVASTSDEESKHYCEKHFTETVTRNETGRFVVRLPFNPLKDELGMNYEDAQRRLCAIENRLRRNPALKDAYTQFMKEYEDMGHMSKCESTTKGYFIPHHAVLREHSTSTKCRCVFDASATSSTGLSLNDILHVGPVVQDDLVTILMRFRTHSVAFTSDIVRMYRQFIVHDEDSEYQKILWRHTPSEPVSAYRLNTVTYGTACAPFLATRCLKELGLQVQDANPSAATIILNDFYVDDCITGCASVSEAVYLKRELVSVLNSAGLPLQKWRSNVPDLMTESATSAVILNKSTMNTLGLSWDHLRDVLLYLPSSSIPVKTLTKRFILSEIAKLFDPLGLVGPVILKAKLLMQTLWALKFDWDQALPAEISKEWNDCSTELGKLVLITAPRCLFQSPYISVELHGFSDASKVAYGCCIYVRAVNIQGVATTQLLCAKSRVAPIKTDTQCETTLPRLELCGALLLAQLMHKVLGSISMNFSKSYCWSDSSIVLCWLASPPQNYKPFVSNRVRDIQKLTAHCSWRHVRTDSNPADLISRGVNTITLKDSDLWWSGPQFLTLESSQWPQLELSQPGYTRECKATPISTFVNIVQSLDIVQRYSSLVKLVRVTTHCLRFINNCRARTRTGGVITALEYSKSLHRLITLEQRKCFQKEIGQLKRNELISTSSSILSLNPMLDNEGMLHVGGRLRHANIPHTQQHPIILPSHNALTELIINYEHLRLLHAGQQAVLSSLRLKYWPLSGKSTVRKILRRCIRCCRVKPTAPMQYIMGDLPMQRVTPSRPFSSAGVDYCGPFSVVSSHRRGIRPTKAYVAVFVCFATKATHLEMVGDLTTEACLNALRRFIARRGIISHLYSDNGTNFIGCHNELKRLSLSLSTEEAQAQLATLQISWHFIPPRSPHFGGLWEAAVKSAKYHLKRIASQTSLTVEEFSTVLAQTEACLNSRPLVPISDDHNDLGALTPGHFLIGQPLTSLPDATLTDVPQNRLSRWQRVQQINQHFWNRWHKEYLAQLQTRTKWKQQQRPLSVGALVIVREDNLPPLRWKLGRVLEVILGADNVPRVALIKTASSTDRVSVKRLCLLPIEPLI